jgi:dihydrofolate synthase/folylpolyglutamate synthase
MNYQETLDWLFKQLPVFQRVGKAAYKADLDNTYAIMDVLGQPQHQFKSIHIAGTNGKGSTAHLLASVFQEAGYKTGLYTSPHLRDFRERIRINGQKIPQNKVIGFVENHHEEFLKIKPSFFEMTVGMAFKYFNDEQVDIAIIETGLGGRLDSTNIINPELSIITNIGMDHTQFLGNTLSSIAQEKAGIIKNNIPVIIGEHQEETDQVFIQMAEEKQASLSFAQDHYQAIWKGEDLLVFKDQELFIEISQFPLKGDYQLKNVCTAVAAADSMNISIGFIIKGFQNVLSNTAFAGRWQTINKKPLTICDTAHNQDGLLLVMEQLQKMEYKQLHFVLGVVDDKQLNQILPLFPKEAIYYFCKADIPRGLPVDKLAEQATLFGLKGNKYQSVSLALQAAQKQANSDDLVFAGGSTFTVAELV